MLLLKEIESQSSSRVISEEIKQNQNGQLASEIHTLVSENRPELKDRYDLSVTDEENHNFLYSTHNPKQKTLLELIEEEESILNLFSDDHKKDRLNNSFIDELIESHIFEDDPRQTNSRIIESSLPQYRGYQKFLGNRSNSIEIAGYANNGGDNPPAKHKKYIRQSINF